MILETCCISLPQRLFYSDTGYLPQKSAAGVIGTTSGFWLAFDTIDGACSLDSGHPLQDRETNSVVVTHRCKVVMGFVLTYLCIVL